MDGRWVITKSAFGDLVHGPHCERMPVIPCDAEAVRRAADALKAMPPNEEPYAVVRAIFAAAAHG